MAPRACAALALVGLGVAAVGFALAGTVSAGDVPTVAITVALIGLVGGGLAAARWLRATAPRREWDRRR